jgi:APA family basic amino acid/polyamine antiporter
MSEAPSGKAPSRRKSVEAIRRECETAAMHRTLGPFQLVMIGIGCIVGAGVFVMTGTAASHHAGPAVALSFVIAAFACLLVCLCYAELASVLPASGASYSYAYAVLGQGFAWGLGWMLMLEFGLAGSALAVGFSGYLTSLLGDFGLIVPKAAATPWLLAVAGPDGMSFAVSGGLNLVAVAALVAAMLVVIRGVAHSAAINALLVVVKIGVLTGFVIVGARHVDSANLTPFIPANEGGFRFGVEGVFRAASILFFSYLGFEAVAAAAAEARRPQRDVPIGIVGALIASTLLYVAVALTLTGIVSYRALDVPDPIAIAVNAIGMPVFAVVIKVGALAGLGSVLLVNTYAQSRICHAIARDGLLPPALARLHPRYRTPVAATISVATISAAAAAVLPISLLADLVSLGTLCVFMTVAIAVIVLRNSHPDLPRPFRVPFGGVRLRGRWIGTVPVLALLSCVLMGAPVLTDIALKAASGEWIPAAILGSYITAGAALYLFYGRPRTAGGAPLDV